MKRTVLVCVLVLLGFFSQKLPAEESDSLIFPDPSQKICLVRADESQGDILSGTVIAKDSALAQKIALQLELPFHQSVLKLSQCSRNLVSDKEGPNVLFLSRNEGGFPRQGLILTQGEDTIELPNLFFVDLVLDEQRLDRGDLDIFSHEMGHVMMLNIWQNIPDQRSNKQHVSMGITDYTTAVFEGWGVHFQRLAYDNIPLYLDQYLQNFDYSRSLGRSWHSSVDQDLRINGVLNNSYVHQKLLPGIELDELSQEELILLEHASPIFDRTRLRTAQQMLSCEGVLATIFYRINTNPKLRQDYREKEFYAQFLLHPMPGGLKPRELFTPFENVMLKHFWVWSRLNNKMTGESILPLEYIEEWGRSFPEDKEEIYTLFVLTTVGKTVSNTLGNIYERMALFGMRGDIQNYRGAFSDFQESFSPFMKDVLTGKVGIGANVGPQLWEQNHALLMRRALWDPSNKRPLWINLNTASVYELASFPGMNLASAEKVVEERAEKGYFESLEDAASCGIKLKIK